MQMEENRKKHWQKPGSGGGFRRAWAADGFSGSDGKHTNRRNSLECMVNALQFEEARRSGGDMPEQRAVDFEGLDIRPEDFHEETTSIERRLEDSWRSIRLEHLVDNEAEERERKAKVEAEQRRREAEHRRERAREQEAKDPKKKILLRLVNRRLFESGDHEDMLLNEKATNIPMRSIEFGGGKGVEKVNLVDVHLLRARCTQVSNGSSIRLLLESRDKEERRQAFASFSLEPSTATTSAKISAATSSGMLGGLGSSTVVLPGELSYEERKRRAQKQKKALAEANALRKIHLMRSELPDYGKSRYGEVQQRQRADLHRIPPELEKFRRRMAALGEITAHKDRATRNERHRLKLAAADLWVQETITIQNAEERARNAEAHERACRRWGLMRAASAWLLVYSHVCQLENSADAIKGFLRHAGEWSRMKAAMRHLVKSIEQVQAAFRRHSVQKRMHLDNLEQEWQHIEDEFLGHYFKLYYRKLFDVPGRQQAVHFELDAPSSRNEQRRQMLMNKIVDWQKFRIPPKERRGMLNHEYIMRLRRRVQIHSHLVTAILTASGFQKDLETFLKQFGGTAAQLTKSVQPREDEVRLVTPPCFWELSEDDILSLIGIAARRMRDVPPFQDHPANNDMFEKLFGPEGKACRSAHKMKSGLPLEPEESATAPVSGQVSGHASGAVPGTPAHVQVEPSSRSAADL